MATFQTQVQALTSLSLNDLTSSPSRAELSQYLTDGAAEVINAMPPRLKYLCATEDSFTSTAVGSEAETLESSSVLSVTRNDGTIEQPCREIPSSLRGRASDSDDMIAATATDPVYYIYNGKLNALPASGNCKYLEVNNPTVAYGDSSISNFPDEYEYLVPLYGAVKSLQSVLSSRSSNSDIDTALTAMNTELDETQAICDLINDQVDAAVVQLGESATQVDASVDTALAAIATASGRINSAVVEASAEFDKSDALLDLGEADTESDVNNALTGMHSTIDSVLPNVTLMAQEVALINGTIDDGITEANELATFTDSADASSGFNTALTALNSAIDQFRATSGAPALFGDASTYTTGTGLTSVKTHIDRAISYVDGNFPNANYDLSANLSDIDTELTNEDIELASARNQQFQATIDAINVDLKIARSSKSQSIRAFSELANGYSQSAQGYGRQIQAGIAVAEGYANEVRTRLQQAQAKREEARSRVDLGNAYLAEARLAVEEVSSFSAEVNARISQVSGYGQVISGYINAAQGYASEITNKINIAQGYSNEIGARLSVDNAQYAFYEKQQAKLQADYDKGIQIMRGG